MNLPRRVAAHSFKLLFAALLLGGCQPPPPLSTEARPAAGYFENPALASVIQQAREELLEERSRRAWRPPSKRLLLPPLGGEESAAARSALSWWLLRFEAGLLPRPLDGIRSVAELQAHSRRVADGSEYWLIDTVGTEPTRVELILVRDGTVLRSREFVLFDEKTWSEWPLDPGAATARLTGVAGTALFRSEQRLILETSEGRARLEFRNGRLRVGELQRLPALPRRLPPLPQLEIVREDLRLSWSQRMDADGRCVEGWSVARLGAAMPLPLHRASPAPILAVESLATSRGERWVVLRESGVVELHEVSMRWTRPSLAVSRGAARRIEIARPAVSTSSRDPLSCWARSASRAPLHALAESMDRAGRRWRFDSGAAAEAAGRGLEQAIAEGATALAWSAVASLQGLSMRIRGDELELVGSELPNDLRERLRHPSLWIPSAGDAIWEWANGESPALRCEWPESVGKGDPPGQGTGGVNVVLLFSAAAPARDRARVERALSGLGISELFALTASEWEPRTPVGHRPWPRDARAVEAESVGPLHLMLQVDPTLLADGERERFLRRLGVLLGEHGIRLSVLGGTATPTVDRSSILAQLTRLALYHEEALLRALELGAWCGLNEWSPRIQAALRLPPENQERREAALELEAELMASAAFVPLWRESVRCQADGRLLLPASWNPLLPPAPAALRWHPAAAFPAASMRVEP